MVVFFFFKQKTAYEMRISDWSSDVCSSDLGGGPARRQRRGAVDNERAPRHSRGGALAGCRAGPWDRCGLGIPERRVRPHERPHGGTGTGRCLDRSEEHTSELQSLMRISYAVFCLKKKTIIIPD